jgi:hypothetical protein
MVYISSPFKSYKLNIYKTSILITDGFLTLTKEHRMKVVVPENCGEKDIWKKNVN